MLRILITALDVTAMVMLCAFVIGCARDSQAKESEGRLGGENITASNNLQTDKALDKEDVFPEEIGTFELVEVNSVEDFRRIYLEYRTLYFGHDADFEYLGAIGIDYVYKIRRKIVDGPALRKIQVERSKTKYVAHGPRWGIGDPKNSLIG
jgi:hypothetical protein